MVDNFKDVFIIHSKSDSLEEILVSKLTHLLNRMNISTYIYSDWEWNKTIQKTKFRSSGFDLDLVRYSMGHPEPFRRKISKEVPDEFTLKEMLGNSRVIVFIAPRAGSPSAGVYLEYKILPIEPAVVLASWGSHNDWLVTDRRHSFHYNIRDLYSRSKDDEAINLAHITWLHWMIDHLAYESRYIGCKLLAEFAKHDAAMLRILKFAYRLSKYFKEPLEASETHDLEAIQSAALTIAKTSSAKEAKPIALLWTKQKVVYENLPQATDLKIRSLLEMVNKGLDVFCAEVLRLNPTLLNQ